jgi:hypothetical protein
VSGDVKVHIALTFTTVRDRVKIDGNVSMPSLVRFFLLRTVRSLSARAHSAPALLDPSSLLATLSCVCLGVCHKEGCTLDDESGTSKRARRTWSGVEGSGVLRGKRTKCNGCLVGSKR